MAREFKLLFVLWLVVACLEPTTTQNTTTTTVASNTTTTTTTTVPSTTTNTTTTTVPSTTTNTTTTTVPSTTTNTTTTTVPSTTTNTTTTTVPSTTTSETPAVSSTATTDKNPTPVPTTTKLPGPCDGNPCYDGSNCEPRSNQAFVCLCLTGDSYDYSKKSCVRAKVFPGQLNLPRLEFLPNMLIKTSTEFLNASIAIVAELEVVFKGNDAQYTVLEFIKLFPKDRKVSSTPVYGVSATVEIMFPVDSDIKTVDVTQKLKKASECAGCLLGNASFADTDMCLDMPCDKNTTKCVSGDGFYNCTCLAGFIETDFSNRICIACPYGQQIKDSICVACSFGFSGSDCKESWVLKLVIVGSVLGGLLLITLILLPIVSIFCKSSKKSSKKDKNADMGKPYVSHPPAKQQLVNGNLAQSQAASFNRPANGPSAYANAGMPRIPRATTTNSWDSRTNLEMTPSNSRQNLIPVGRNSRFYNDQDDMNPHAQVRPQSNLYAQVRPSNNPYAQSQPQTKPYAQSQPQTNPYAQSQGHSNPYYTHDNGRRLN